MDNKATICEEKIIIPTYGVGEPDRNPLFLEKRVYQGSSGKVYPYPVIDKIYDEKYNKEYTGVWLENKYIKILLLPELGGRIQRAYDKTNDYDFVYYNEVIKPALVGLLGPWISGGIEFNWPQHHRPTTFAKVDYQLIENDDGSVCCVCSEVDQMYGTKGEMFFTLYPNKAYIEIKGRLYNRTNLPQTFLWWANPAVAVNDYTQSIFPPDVTAVFDHGKRDVSNFPIATGVYYKYDYGKGVDISRYKNIPVPTSYMCYKSKYNFIGGYDHSKKAGLLHVADHHVSPGKKQWTWGNGDFGRAWDRNLTDNNGPYIELMTGVFTDNQPDFTWLKPFEEKTFTQYFMPYKDLGAVKNANAEVAINLERIDPERIKVLVYATSEQKNARITLCHGNKAIFEETTTISPVDIFHIETACSAAMHELTLSVYSETGRLMLEYSPEKDIIPVLPEAAQPAKEPKDIQTIEELYLTGLHLEQYRHATYEPEDYYLEALRRDNNDSRTNIAYGMLLLRKGCFKESEEYFLRAINRVTFRNPNPYSGEAFFYLGLALWYENKLDDAYDMFYKATWSNEQQESSFYYLAAIDCKRHDYLYALEHIDRSLVKNSNNLKARALKAYILHCVGKTDAALQLIEENTGFEVFDYTSAIIKCIILDEDISNVAQLMNGRLSSHIECAIDLMDAGAFNEAKTVLESYIPDHPMKYYYLAYCKNALGISYNASLSMAEKCSSLYCFPNRLEDIVVLEFACNVDKSCGYAAYYLGCAYYDKKRYNEAVSVWESASMIIPTFPTVWRNLSIAYYNKQNNPEKARTVLEKAFELDKSDARVFQELDQLYKKINLSPHERITNYEKHNELWQQRDELYVEYVTLLNITGNAEKALNLIMNHKFHPWEGGEGKVTGQYVSCLLQLAKDKIKTGQPDEAELLLEKALNYPHNLGEGKLIISTDNNVHYYLGIVEKLLGNTLEAANEFNLASKGIEELAGAMYYNDQPADMLLYQGLACEELGDTDKALSYFHKLISYGEKHYYDNVKIDYFAVSLPELQLFEEDLSFRNRIHCNYLIGLGYLGLGETAKAEEYLNKVIDADHSHQGAIIHSKML